MICTKIIIKLKLITYFFCSNHENFGNVYLHACTYLKQNKTQYVCGDNLSFMK